jgi:hypothetical protein
MKRFYIITILSGIILTNVFAADIMPAPDEPKTIYVKGSASGSEDGTSWNDAYKNLQDAIDASKDGDTILITGGTYKPDPNASDQDKSFVLKSGVKIYGGYYKESEGNDNRRFEQYNDDYITILSGDYEGDNDACHVVVGIALSDETVLDGVTIQGGNANGAGETPYTYGDAQETLMISQTKGGGIYLYNSDPILANIIIKENKADNGGDGGGMYNKESSPTLINVFIAGNTAGNKGGGMYNEGSSPTLTNVTIAGNTATMGGGMFNTNTDDPEYSNPTLNNTILWGNIKTGDNGDAGITNNTNNEPSYNYCLIQGVESTEGGCISAENLDEGDIFVDAAGGDYRIKAGSPTIDRGSDDLYKNAIEDIANEYSGYTLSLDFFNARITGDAIDMGAYETDNVPPTLPSGTANRTSNTNATISFTTDEAGEAFYLVKGIGEGEPDQEAVSEGASLGNVVAGENINIPVTLTAGNKIIYVVVVDVAGNISNILPIEANDEIAPVLTDKSFDRESNAKITINFTATEAGTVYYLVRDNADDDPTEGDFNEDEGLDDAIDGTLAGSIVIDTLTASKKYIYVVMKDVAGNFSNILDIEASEDFPPVLSNESADRTSNTEATVNFTSDEAGTLYYLVRDRDSNTPGKYDVRAGKSPDNNVTEGENEIIIPLTAGNKDIYIIVEDADGRLSDILKIKAYGDFPPVLSDESANRTSNTEATINFTSDEAGETFYLALNSDDEVPTADDVTADGQPLGNVVAGENIDISVPLTAGTKIIYIAVKDATGNTSNLLTLEAEDEFAPTLKAEAPPVRPNDTIATVSFTSDEAGMAYYCLRNDNGSKPSRNEIINEARVADSEDSVAVAAGGIEEIELTLDGVGVKYIYIVVTDAEGNTSEPLEIEIPNESTPPALTKGSPEATRTSATEATVSFTTSEAGTAYCLVSRYEPSITAMKNFGSDSAVVAGEEINITVTNLEDAGAKDLYVIVEDAAGNISNFLEIAIPAFVAPNPPTLTGNFVSRPGDTNATVTITTDQAGDLYYLIADINSYPPTKDMVTEHGIYYGAVGANVPVPVTVTLTAGAKDIYVVVKSATGISAPRKIQIPEYHDGARPILSAISASDTTHVGVKLNFTTDEAGTCYYLVYADSVHADPAAADIKAQGTTASAKGTGATAAAGSNTAVTVAGLTAATAYTAHLIVEDAAGNLSATATIPFTTLAAPDKHIQVTMNGLTVHIKNTGSLETGILTLTLSGEDAGAFTSSSATINSIPVNGEADFTFTPSFGLDNDETYTVTLTVSGEDIEPVELRIDYSPTGNDRLPVKPFKAWMRGATLHVSGLTVGRMWNVYSISGILLHSSIADSDEADITLPAHGIYVITSDGKSIKTAY